MFVPDNDNRIIVIDDEGREVEMCNDDTHPHHLLCCLEAGHAGKHRAEFLNSSVIEEW